MQVRGKLTFSEVKEIPQFNESRWTWPRLLLRNAYGLLLVIGLAWGTAAKVYSGNAEHWLGVSLIWLAVVVILIWAVWDTQRSYKKAFAKLHRQLPDWLIFNEQGMQTTTKRGRTTFRPWDEILTWRKGKSLIRLALAEGGFMFIPFSDLASTERNELEHLLEVHLQSTTR